MTVTHRHLQIDMGSTREKSYKVLHFRDGDCVLVVDVWLYRVDEDATGLTFEEWDPLVDTDASQIPMTIIVNSSEL
jgi:hypothetical protein